MNSEQASRRCLVRINQFIAKEQLQRDHLGRFQLHFFQRENRKASLLLMDELVRPKYFD